LLKPAPVDQKYWSFVRRHSTSALELIDQKVALLEELMREVDHWMT
jgi:hypothetical protein